MSSGSPLIVNLQIEIVFKVLDCVFQRLSHTKNVFQFSREGVVTTSPKPACREFDVAGDIPTINRLTDKYVTERNGKTMESGVCEQFGSHRAPILTIRWIRVHRESKGGQPLTNLCDCKSHTQSVSIS